MRRPQTAPLLLGLLALPSCSDTKDWEREIIVQLFKPQSIPALKITVEAEQGKKKGAVELAGAGLFQSCSTNQVRIIPDPAGGEVTITARVTADPLLRDTQKVAAGQSTPVKLVLSRAGALEPSGCAPPPPDAGVKRRTAEPCAVNAQCAGGLCATEVNASPMAKFKDGYCTSSCDSAPCAADEDCIPYRDGTGKVVVSYCHIKCGRGDAGTDPRCRVGDGYLCSTADLCVPVPVK
jgi:hypothetical protein